MILRTVWLAGRFALQDNGALMVIAIALHVYVTR